MAPNRISLPMRTSTGSVDKCTPNAVSFSPPPSMSSASSSTSCLTACLIATALGGSSKREQTSAAGSTYLSALMVSTRRSSGTREISGGWKLSMTSSCVKLVIRWKATPGRVRPARPRRCLALARETRTSSSDSMRFAGSKRFSFMRPQSMTKLTSSTVMAVSAMFVAMTIFRTPGGARSKTRRCSSGGSMPCRGSTQLR
mmetsp:Transcript_24687/g.65242  ORF Transcript_24687/g.65242 Transcript_24687/m.65242 type:complete len:200 (-) Transcript_24687:170-769(-)